MLHGDTGRVFLQTIINEGFVEEVRSKYKSEKYNGPRAADGTIIIHDGYQEDINNIISFHKSVKKQFPVFGKKPAVMIPGSSRILMIEPGAVYVDMHVECMPKYKASVMINKNGKWVRRPMLTPVLKYYKRKGRIRL